jgi:uncharacterized protein (DUF362 family)/Pyruvate/2-oxoacid:ferredoxin oxidoreductase delta subunit
MSEGAVVSIVAHDSYEPEGLAAAFEKVLEPLGGMGRFVTRGGEALLKPNFLKPAKAEEHVTTHPEFIRAAARCALGAGASKAVVMDSPGISSVARCVRKLGLGDDEPFRPEEPGEAVETSMPEGKFRRIGISRRMLEADALINLPKAKTHGQIVLTLAAKNMFGAVVGLEKAQWHLRAGTGEDDFAKLLVEVCEIVPPRLSILDGVIGLEGNGPGSGDPRPLGLIMASESAHALDAVFCRAIGVDPKMVPTIKVAMEMGLVPPAGQIDIVGPEPESFRPDPPWKMPRPVGLRLVPGPLMGLFDLLFGIRPAVSGAACTMCGECVKVCAAEAMRVSKRKSRAVLNRRKCITCFCCQEICPEGAITIRAGLLSRMFGRRRK